jgi:predicted dehydrogenase
VFRLGIVGSDNSHSISFSSLANLEEGYKGQRIPDVQVTHIYGTDPVRTQEVATKGNIPNIVTNMEEMLGAVDGILCVWRHGSKHLADTAPFLKAGIPAFVDKPLASSVADAEALIDLAEKAKVGFTSFSTLRFSKPTVDFVASLDAIGPVTSGVSTSKADRASEYDGIFFYAIHAVELMNATFGYGCHSVSAVEHNKNIHVACKFASGAIVTLNLLGSAKSTFHVSAFGGKGNRDFPVPTDTTYFDGMTVFMETLRTGKWPFTREQLLEPVKILAATERSLVEKREVALSEV